MKVIKAPEEFKTTHGDKRDYVSIFLGGSIEQGKARDWQTKLTKFIEKQPYADDIIIYNPRRDDWDSSWVNRAYNDQFREQVEWELNHQDSVDLNVYYFAEKTMSPITLLELGLYHSSNPVIGTDEDYQRLGNLEITAEHKKLDLNIGWEHFLLSVDRRLEGIVRNKARK